MLTSRMFRLVMVKDAPAVIDQFKLAIVPSALLRESTTTASASMRGIDTVAVPSVNVTSPLARSMSCAKTVEGRYIHVLISNGET